MRSWATAESLWVRRAAILSQLSSKDETDRQLLIDAITRDEIARGQLCLVQPKQVCADPDVAGHVGSGEARLTGAHRHRRKA